MKKFIWPNPIEAELHITSELSRAGIDYIVGRKDIKICCPFPHDKGSDSKYKLEITRNGKKCHCWVCNWSGSWNKLAPELGLAKFSSMSFESETFTEKVINKNLFSGLKSRLEGSSSTEEGHLPKNLSIWDGGDWRGTTSSFLSKVPSFRWDHSGVDRILWPYYQQGSLVGYVARRLDTSPEVKYYRAPWCSARKVLFPFDFVVDHYGSYPFVVLVEGEFDALYLLSQGIPALSILGSTNWSFSKRDLLLLLSKKHVFVLMDGDAAGKKAAAEIKKSLKSFTSFSVLRLPDGDDPGSLDDNQIEWLKSKISNV